MVDYTYYAQKCKMRLKIANIGMVFIVLFLLSQTLISNAQDSLRIIDATRITEKIKIDGKLDEAVWLESTPFEGNFYQLSPDNGAESTYRSKIYVPMIIEPYMLGLFFTILIRNQFHKN